MSKRSAIRILPIILCLLSAQWCVAQQPSRVVFFRMDAELDEKYSAFGESRLYTDALQRSDETIAKMRSGSAFVYSPTDAAGQYEFIPFISGPGHSNTLRLPELRGEIAFVKISLGGSTPITAELTLVSYSDFERYYEKSRTLRKRLGDAGFLSLTALTNGFTPVFPQTLPGVKAPRKMPRSIGDTVYYDRFDRPGTRQGASYFSTASDSARLYFIRDYYLPERRLKSEHRWLTLDSESREGQSRSFFRNGQLSSRGSYRANRLHGYWEYYRDTVPESLWYTCSYTNGDFDGMLTSYYPNGRVKRKELHRLYPGATGSASSAERKDSIVSGQCFDEMGNEIPFTRFQILPRTDYSLYDWLGKMLRYPMIARRRGTEGRSIVQFVINTNGEVENVEIARSSDRYLDEEAMRVVRAMPPWQPGLQDDKPVQVYFTLPITFKLD